MEVVVAYPPNYVAILAAFPAIKGRDIVFAHGGILFNPMGRPIRPEIMAHEKVHQDQQKVCGAEAWWDRYLKDPSFRLVQEVTAHQVEHQHFLKSGASRHERRRHLAVLAERIASPMYGNLIKSGLAKRLIGATPAPTLAFDA